jgi:hypothetical protein
MKKLFTFLSILFITMSSRAQVVGMIGEFTGWGTSPDVVMSTVDNVNWTVTNQLFSLTGGVKFRLDAAWVTDWGSADFPAGTGTQGGSNIPVPAGNYDVAFNSSTGAYTFTPVVTNFDVIGFNGNFNSYGAAVPMFTTDGIQYVKSDFQFTADGMKFINATASETFGGTIFPIGAAVLNGPEIPVTTGFYNVGFDKSLSGYAFQQVPVGIIGSAIPPYDWTVDVPMTSTDGGVTFTLNNFAINDGVCKFRANASWATNWGGTGLFPSGTAELNGNNNDIAVVAGTYNISFNRVTGAFSFETASLTENQLVKVSVSPNPANEVVNFNIDAENFTITLVDMAGKVVATSTSNDMNISSLNNGLYTYLVNTANGVATGKLIKQ